MIDPVSLIGVNVATGLLQGIFSPSKETSPAVAFDNVMEKYDAAKSQMEKASELVGMTVQVEKNSGKIITGVVEKVFASETGIQLQINGKQFGLERLRNVLPQQNQGVII